MTISWSFSYNSYVKLHGKKTYILWYVSPNKKFEYGYPHSNVLVTYFLQNASENVVCYAYSHWLPAG